MHSRSLMLWHGTTHRAQQIVDTRTQKWRHLAVLVSIRLDKQRRTDFSLLWSSKWEWFRLCHLLAAIFWLSSAIYVGKQHEHSSKWHCYMWMENKERNTASEKTKKKKKTKKKEKHQLCCIRHNMSVLCTEKNIYFEGKRIVCFYLRPIGIFFFLSAFRSLLQIKNWLRPSESVLHFFSPNRQMSRTEKYKKCY